MRDINNEQEYNEVVREIKKTLKKIQPFLVSDGGDVEFIDFVDGIVYVRLLGACVECNSLDATLKDGIESLLTANILEVREVRNVE